MALTSFASPPFGVILSLRSIYRWNSSSPHRPLQFPHQKDPPNITRRRIAAILSYRAIIFCSVPRPDDGALHPARTVGGRDDVTVWACQVCARGHKIGIALADVGLAIEKKVHVVAGQPLVKLRCQTLARDHRRDEVRRHNDNQIGLLLLIIGTAKQRAQYRD